MFLHSCILFNYNTRKKIKLWADTKYTNQHIHKTDREYQLWQEGIQPKLMQTDVMMISKIKYIRYNPVKRGYVDEASHWRYSSARDYEGTAGLLDVERFLVV